MLKDEKKGRVNYVIWRTVRDVDHKYWGWKYSFVYWGYAPNGQTKVFRYFSTIIELCNISATGFKTMNYYDNMCGQMIGWPGGSPGDTSPRSNREPPTLTICCSLARGDGGVAVEAWAVGCDAEALWRVCVAIRRPVMAMMVKLDIIRLMWKHMFLWWWWTLIL